MREMAVDESIVKRCHAEGMDVEALSASTREDLGFLGITKYGVQTKLLARARRHVQQPRSNSSSASSMGNAAAHMRMFHPVGAGSHSSSIRSVATTHNASTETLHMHNASTEYLLGAGINTSMKSVATAHNASNRSLGQRSSGAATQVGAQCEVASSPKHILIIEDDVPTRALMVHGLKKRGFVIHQAGNGAEGLEMMQKRTYNMVLSDIMMPVMDGLECTQRLRSWEAGQGAARPKQFVCALSANTGEIDVTKAMDAGMDDFFPKPVKIAQLLAFLDGKFM